MVFLLHTGRVLVQDFLDKLTDTGLAFGHAAITQYANPFALPDQMFGLGINQVYIQDSLGLGADIRVGIGTKRMPPAPAPSVLRIVVVYVDIFFGLGLKTDQ